MWLVVTCQNHPDMSVHLRSWYVALHIHQAGRDQGVNTDTWWQPSKLHGCSTDQPTLLQLGLWHTNDVWIILHLKKLLVDENLHCFYFFAIIK